MQISVWLLRLASLDPDQALPAKPLSNIGAIGEGKDPGANPLGGVTIDGPLEAYVRRLAYASGRLWKQATSSSNEYLNKAKRTSIPAARRARAFVSPMKPQIRRRGLTSRRISHSDSDVRASFGRKTCAPSLPSMTRRPSHLPKNGQSTGSGPARMTVIAVKKEVFALGAGSSMILQQHSKECWWRD